MNVTNKNIMISSCDTKFFKYAIPMYTSFKKFNKNTAMYFGNVNCTTEQLQSLKDLGVIIVNTEKVKLIKQNILSYCFLDLLLYDFLKEVKFDKVMWIDTDTLILKRIENLFSYEEDFIGHPGRNKEGAIMLDDNFPYIGFGLWVTSSKQWLKTLSDNFMTYEDRLAEGVLMRKLLKESDLKVKQLDPSIWNFSRDLVKEALLDEKGLYYKVYPATIGFSRLNNNTRGDSEGIRKWYNLNMVNQ